MNPTYKREKNGPLGGQKGLKELEKKVNIKHAVGGYSKTTPFWIKSRKGDRSIGTADEREIHLGRG